MKAKHQVEIKVFGVFNSNGDILLLFIFAHVLRHNLEVYIKYLDREDPMSCNRILHHVTQTREPKTHTHTHTHTHISCSEHFPQRLLDQIFFSITPFLT